MTQERPRGELEGLELQAHSALRGSGRPKINDVDRSAESLRIIAVVEGVLPEIRGVEEARAETHDIDQQDEQVRDQAAGAARVRLSTDGWLLNLPG